MISKKNAVKHLIREGYQLATLEAVLQDKTNGKDKIFAFDPDLADVLVFPIGTTLHHHPLVNKGSLILQDKASCLPPYALAPHKHEIVIDACAAPGNKTTQLSALMNGTGRVIAFDRDPKRFAVLQKTIRKAHATSTYLHRRSFVIMMYRY